MLSVTDELKGPGLVFTMLRKCFGEDFDAKGNCSQVAFTRDYRNAVFDIPSELDEKLKTYWKDSPRIQMKPIKELPQLDDSSRNGSRGFSRSNNGPARGGSYTGNRNSERSNACFKCNKEGHKSFECPESRRSGGHGQSNSNGCFNCGKDGHKSFDCPEPRKGRSSSGGGGLKRSYTGNHDNNYNTGETSNKKIRFNDDDD